MIQMKSIFFLLLLTLISCSSEKKPKLNYQEYIEYFKEPTEKVSKPLTFDDLKYTCKFLSLDWLILNASGKKQLSDSEIKIERAKYDPLDWVFDYHIKLNEHGDVLKYNLSHIDEYRERIQILNTGLEKMFWIEANGEKLECKQAIFDRAYSLSDKLQLRLYFKGIEPISGKLKLCFEDQIFGNGIVKHDIKNQLVNSPVLILN